MKKSFLLIAIFFLGLHVNQSFAKARFNMTIHGVNTHQFMGETVVNSRGVKSPSNIIPCLSYKFDVTNPFDPKTGKLNGGNGGKAVYKPFTIVKEVGNCSPQLLEAFRTKEKLDKIIMEFSKTDSNGIEHIYYRITLTNAQLLEVQQFKNLQVNNNSSPDFFDLHELEQCSFNYQFILFENLDAGTHFADDWTL